MLSYCLKCRKNTESKNPVAKTENGRIMILSKSQCLTVKNQDLSKGKKVADY